jgi:Circadian oscillating protein COP23
MELTNLIPPDDLSGNTKFYSGEAPYEGTIAPMIIYTSENGRFLFWLKLKPIGINYPSDLRAKEVAGRLDRYRREKMLDLAWGTLNKEQIICAYTEKKPGNCQLVVTVPSDVNVEQVLALLQCKLKSPDDPKCSAPIKS